MSDSLPPPELPAPPAPVDTVELLDGGSEAFPRMLAAIQTARNNIHLEIYTFKRDIVGLPFLTALLAAAARGVKVRVVVDAWGSGNEGRLIVAALEAAGCSAEFFHPIGAMLRGKFQRNHRKVLLVDDEVAFLGGINIGEEYAGRVGWADLALEIRSPTCAWLGRKLRGEHPGPGSHRVQILLSGTGGGRRLRKRYLKAIGSATRSLVIAHAYFLPDHRMVRSIRAAARRGVAVSLLLAGRSDVPFAQTGSRRLYRQLLEAGVQIHEWQTTVLHAKAAAVDGRLTFVGSFNLDPLSLSNLEALVEVHDPTVTARFESWVRERISTSRTITLADCQAGSALHRWVLDVLGLWAARLSGVLGRLLAWGPRRHLRPGAPPSGQLRR